MSFIPSLLDLSPETFDLLNFILNFLTFIITIIGSIFIIAISIKNKWFKFKNPPDWSDGHDYDFSYLCHIQHSSNLKNYTPDSNKEKEICERLVSRGVFAKTPTGSYKITSAGKKMIHRSKNPQ